MTSTPRPANTISDATSLSPIGHLAATLKHLYATVPLIRRGGTTTSVTEHSVTVEGLPSNTALGDFIEIETAKQTTLAEIIKLDHQSAMARPFDRNISLMPGAPAWHNGSWRLNLGPGIKGRIVDALFNPIDGAPAWTVTAAGLPIDIAPPNALRRDPISVPLVTGVKCIDILCPISRGQRLGLFAGSGVGKSTLLTMLSTCTGFDSVVFALVGERGREVQNYLDHLPPEIRARSLAVVSTSDQSASLRRLAPRSAMRAAEYLRDQGEHVLLVVDSLTRYAHACREIALSSGEPPVARGFPPSVFADLPRFLERAGTGHKGAGSITAIISVLVDGDNHNDPIADSVRGIVDGHIILDRGIAEQSRYPAVDPLRSISRLADVSWSVEQRRLVATIKRLIHTFEDTKDIRMIAGYQSGKDATLDVAVSLVPAIYAYFTQAIDEKPATDPFSDLLKRFPLLAQLSL
jgi:flagellum-specific ATP synthase